MNLGDVLSAVIIIWWVGVAVTWLAIKYNWKKLGSLVLDGVPEDSVGSMVFMACLFWFVMAAIWVWAWIKERFR